MQSQKPTFNMYTSLSIQLTCEFHGILDYVINRVYGLLLIGEKYSLLGRASFQVIAPWLRLVSREGPDSITPIRTLPSPLRAPVCMMRATPRVPRTVWDQMTGSTRDQAPETRGTVGTTSISVEVGDTTFICVIVIFEVTNRISGKVGTLTLIEYQIRDYQYLSGGSDADLYRMYVCNS